MPTVPVPSGKTPQVPKVPPGGPQVPPLLDELFESDLEKMSEAIAAAPLESLSVTVTLVILDVNGVTTYGQSTHVQPDTTFLGRPDQWLFPTNMLFSNRWEPGDDPANHGIQLGEEGPFDAKQQQSFAIVLDGKNGAIWLGEAHDVAVESMGGVFRNTSAFVSPLTNATADLLLTVSLAPAPPKPPIPQ